MTGKREGGFTLIELMVVLLIISTLAGLIAPAIVDSLNKAREAALKEDLYVMRRLLDDYFGDKGNYPETLEHLVDEGYARSVPEDPFTERNDTWVVTRDEELGISDIHSGFEGVARDGSYIRDW